LRNQLGIDTHMTMGTRTTLVRNGLSEMKKAGRIPFTGLKTRNILVVKANYGDVIPKWGRSFVAEKRRLRTSG